jgi:hypothetical protein
MASLRPTKLKQGILSSIWLEVIGSDELKCINLETKKAEKQVVISDR